MLRTAPTDVLLVTDVQRDFCEGGALPVPDGDEIVSPINALIGRFAHVVAVQDWHPPGHVSFASTHGRQPFETVVRDEGPQTLWPDHCLQGTQGAEFHPRLRIDRFELILRKGFRAHIDSYSAFQENDRRTPTGLAGYLRERGFRRVICAGLALDYCVRWSAEDARRLGFDVMVVVDACRAIAGRAELADALDALRSGGVRLVNSDEVERGGG